MCEDNTSGLLASVARSRYFTRVLLGTVGLYISTSSGFQPQEAW